MSQCELETFNKVVKDISRFRGDQDLLSHILDSELSQSKETFETSRLSSTIHPYGKEAQVAAVGCGRKIDGQDSRAIQVTQKRAHARFDSLKIRKIPSSPPIRSSTMWSLLQDSDNFRGAHLMSSNPSCNYPRHALENIVSGCFQVLVQQSTKAVIETQEMLSSRFLDQGVAELIVDAPANEEGETAI